MTSWARARRRQGRILFCLMTVIVIVINFPIITMVLNSFRTTDQILSSASLVPESFSLVNFEFLTNRTSYWRYFANSMLVSGVNTAIGIAAAALAGYAISRYRLFWLQGYSRGLLMVQMFPIILALIPLFILFRALGLINSPLSVIIIYTVVHLPFATWMFKAFFDTIPRELEEAAQIDGCTRFQAFYRIVLPLSGPGTAAVAIFSFLFSYNEFFIASVFLREESVMTLPVGIQMFVGQYATDWGSLMAAATLTMIPTFLLFMFVQKYLMYGAVAGGVKG